MLLICMWTTQHTTKQLKDVSFPKHWSIYPPWTQGVTFKSRRLIFLQAINDVIMAMATCPHELWESPKWETNMQPCTLCYSQLILQHIEYCLNNICSLKWSVFSLHVLKPHCRWPLPWQHSTHHTVLALVTTPRHHRNQPSHEASPPQAWRQRNAAGLWSNKTGVPLFR